MGREREFDCQREAEAAIKLAAVTTGFERSGWVRVAQAWHDLGRGKAWAGLVNAITDRHDASQYTAGTHNKSCRGYQ
jgi:hypothetical protein